MATPAPERAIVERLQLAKCAFCGEPLMRVWLEPGAAAEGRCRSCKKGKTLMVCVDEGGRATIKVYKLRAQPRPVRPPEVRCSTA